MATADEIRAWAQTQDIEIGVRGRIPAAVREAYDVAHPDDPNSSISHQSGRENSSSPDYPEGMTEDDFSDPAGPPPADMAEARPSPTARPRRPFPHLPAKKGKAKAKHRAGPRVPIDEAVATMWGTLANLARPIPPLHRTLQYQAPVAGLLLEDEVKGTVVDRALQPLARLQAHGDTVVALAGPPILVTALTLHVQRAQLAGTDPNPVFMALGASALRQAVVTMMKVAGPKFAVAQAQAEQLEEEYGHSADELVSLLLYGPQDLGPDAPADAQQAEDDAIRRVQGMM